MLERKGLKIDWKLGGEEVENPCTGGGKNGGRGVEKE